MLECQLTVQELELEVDSHFAEVKMKMKMKDGEVLEIEGCLCGDPTT
jgi:hypothetical protein